MEKEAESEAGDRKRRQQQQRSNGNGSSEGSKEGPAHKDIILTSSKLTLWNAQQTRGIIGSVWDFMLAPEKHEAAVEAKAVGKKYDDTVKEKGKKHGLGAPHLHTAAAYIKTLAIKAEKGKHIQLELMAMILPFMSQTQLDDILPYFRIQQITAGDSKGKFKITFFIHPLAMPPTDNTALMEKAKKAKKEEAGMEEAEKARQLKVLESKMSMAELRRDICQAMESETCSRGSGSPPKGDLERKLQKLVAEMQDR